MPLKHRGNLLIFIPSKATTYTAHCKLLVWVIGCVLEEYSHILSHLVKRKRAQRSIFCRNAIAPSLLPIPLAIDCTKMFLSAQCSPFPVPSGLI